MNSEQIEEIAEEILEHAHFKLLNVNPINMDSKDTFEYVKEFKRRLIGTVRAREEKGELN